ncbi:MAG: hypothetical protein U5M51_16310, partial [Emticicia sp.]|nr:hypothetical protein [Emticicia sp.]
MPFPVAYCFFRSIYPGERSPSAVTARRPLWRRPALPVNTDPAALAILPPADGTLPAVNGVKRLRATLRKMVPGVLLRRILLSRSSVPSVLDPATLPTKACMIDFRVKDVCLGLGGEALDLFLIFGGSYDIQIRHKQTTRQR